MNIAAAGGLVNARDFSTDKRKKMAKEGTALPDGSFPIANEEDVHNAVSLLHNAKNPTAAKAHIRKRAKALGMGDPFGEVKAGGPGSGRHPEGGGWAHEPRPKGNSWNRPTYPGIWESPARQHLPTAKNWAKLITTPTRGGYAGPNAIHDSTEKFGNRTSAESRATERLKNGEDVSVVSVNDTEHHVVPSSSIKRFGPPDYRNLHYGAQQ